MNATALQTDSKSDWPLDSEVEWQGLAIWLEWLEVLDVKHVTIGEVERNMLLDSLLLWLVCHCVVSDRRDRGWFIQGINLKELVLSLAYECWQLNACRLGLFSEDH